MPSIMDILGGEEKLGTSLENRLDFIKLCSRGIRKESLSDLERYLYFTKAQIAHLLDISQRTLQRYSDNDYLSSSISEKVLNVAEVIARGVEVFGDKKNFLAWMSQPNTAFANLSPFDLLTSRFGAEMILDALGRIEHGVYG